MAAAAKLGVKCSNKSVQLSLQIVKINWLLWQSSLAKLLKYDSIIIVTLPHD